MPAPVAAGVEIKSATRLKGDAALGVPPGQFRFYVVADVKALLRGDRGLPARVSYLVDVSGDAANRPPKLRKARMLVLAATVPNRPGELRLIGPGAQIAWTPEVESRLRAILVAAVARDAPPRVTGVGKAFHVPGSLPGESETQIFLQTDDGRPISLSVLRRPGEAPRWAVALGEMVDEAAAPPAPDTLLWYRLACFLPATLPDSSIEELDPAAQAATREDYAVIVRGLGPCNRQKDEISTPTAPQSS